MHKTGTKDLSLVFSYKQIHFFPWEPITALQGILDSWEIAQWIGEFCTSSLSTFPTRAMGKVTFWDQVGFLIQGLICI